MRDIACELAPAVNHDRPRFVAGMIEDLDLTRLDDEEFESPVANRNKGLTVLATSWQQCRALSGLRNLSVVKNRKGNRMKGVLCHTSLFLLPKYFGVALSVRIETGFVSLVPCHFQFRIRNVPVRTALFRDRAQVLAKIFYSRP